MHHHYTHAIILDFEATCDDKQKPSPQEIIEFPSVLISLKTMGIIDEFQSFVKPYHHPVLSEFCKSFTSIQQKDVDNAELFSIVLEKHGVWLKDHDLSEKNAIIVTCGDWDLHQMLPEQCRVCEPIIEVIPPIYRQWENIKKTFCSVMGVAKAPGMAGMLKELEIPLEGHHHRGIDDCRNIAKIYTTLLEKGSKPHITGSIRLKKYPPIRITLNYKSDLEIITLKTRELIVLKNLVQMIFKIKPLKLYKKNGEIIKEDEELLDLIPLEEIIIN